MFTDAAQRRFDLVLVWALDRLTREGVAETFNYIKRLGSHAVQFVSFTEEHFRTTGPAGALMIAVAAWIAKQERVRISERVRTGLSRAKQQGTRSGNPVGRPKAIFDRQKVVALRNQGRSLREIARACNAGVTTVRRAYGVFGSIASDSGVPKIARIVLASWKEVRSVGFSQDWAAILEPMGYTGPRQNALMSATVKLHMP